LEKEKEKSYTYTCREEATMREEKSKTNKLAWSKKMVRKWFNIKSKTEEFQADDPSSAGIEVEHRSSFSAEKAPSTIKNTKTGKKTHTYCDLFHVKPDESFFYGTDDFTGVSQRNSVRTGSSKLGKGE
jgi:hypothetical protein